MSVTTEGDARRTRRRGRTWMIGLAAVAFVGLTSLRGIAGFYTTYLWFGELGLKSVWGGVLGTKILLVAVFRAVFFVLLFLNLVIADRLAPRFRPSGPEDELVQRYRQIVGPHAAKMRLGVSALFALLAGTGVSAQWNNWLLFRNAVDFGGAGDPQFGKDIGFYVFTLPFLLFVVNWAFVAMVIVAVVTVVAHYLNGGIRVQAPVQRVTPQVKAHISVLLGVLALIKAVGYYLQRFELTLSSRGVVDGASFTDVKAQLPALELLVFISLAAAALFLYNIRRQGWVLPAVGVGLWAFISVVVGAIYPAFTQKFRVEPAEIRRERPFIERNIAATRQAYGLDKVEQSTFDYDEALSAEDLQQNTETVRNVRLWDPQFVDMTFQKLQEIKSYYRFQDVDIDRYQIDGRTTQAIVSVRELSSEDLPSDSWVNRHLLFTHGFGALVAPANAVTPDGKPAFVLKDIPPEGTPALQEPRIYYGETTGGYAIVKSKQEELDFQRPDGTSVSSSYKGTGGVPMSSTLRRLAFALRFADFNPLISNLVTPQSRAIFIRDIGSRVRTAAPFLRYDADPYPVIIKGRVLWIQDAYTATTRYPYSQHADRDRVPAGSDLRSNFNYVRNSVKVVIDAFNGSMQFYVVDDKDPLIKAYTKAFPKLFTPGSKMSADLRSHLRYPEDLFRVQTNMYGRYHITAPADFYNASDAWNISQDPGSGSPTPEARRTTTNAAGTVLVSAKEARMDPTYMLLRLPGEEKESFLILQPFVPFSDDDKQQNLTAFMTAKSDVEGYGRLQAFVMPRGRQIDGPALVDARISANPAISSEITLLDQKGSEVQLGNVLVIPIGNSLLHIRPLYVQSKRNPLPEFKKAIVVFGEKAEMRDTLQQALAAVFGAAPPTLEQPKDGPGPPTTSPPGTPAVSAEAQRLLGEADAAFKAGQEALRNGDLAEYQRQNEIAAERVRQALTPVTQEPAPATTTTTSRPPKSTA
ncbi:MAG TPA: UPF0182 family protein [Acidimicrobiales bacterium]|nr:UPF0182 family protein [Acidimicrobiales bacterium]